MHHWKHRICGRHRSLQALAMNYMMLTKLSYVSGRLRNYLLPLACTFIGLGQATADELIDLTFFRPPPAASRKINSPIVRWSIKSNPETFCTTVSDKDGVTATRGGCAYWQTEKSSCTVVTASSTTHSVLGHLLVACLLAGQKS